MGYRFKLLISAAIVAAIFLSVDVPGVFGHLLTMDGWFILGATALFLGGQAVEAVKLRLFLPDRPFGELFAFTLLVQLYALVLPGQLAGEAVKAYRLCRGQADGGAIVSAVVFDKVSGLISLLVLTVGALLLESGRFGAAMVEVVAGCLVVFVVFTGVLAADRPQLVLLGFLERIGRVWPRLNALVSPLCRFLETWRAFLRRPRLLVPALLYGLMVQLLAVGSAYMLALGLAIDLSFAAWCVVFGVMSVVVLVPVTIGGLGLREASMVGLLVALGVGREPALALALAVFAFKVMTALLAAALDLAVLRGERAPGVSALDPRRPR